MILNKIDKTGKRLESFEKPFEECKMHGNIAEKLSNSLKGGDPQILINELKAQ